MRLSWVLWLLLLELPSLAHGQAAHAAANPHPTQSPSNTAPANDVEVARVHFKNGVDSYRDGDLSTALIEFKRAYTAAKNYRLLFNLGQVSDELRDYTEAEHYFREYLREGGDEIDAARRQDVQAALIKVTGRIVSLVLTTNATGATFYVDDVVVGDAPVRDPVRVSAGRRRVSATLAGHPRITEMVDAAGGETLVVHLEFPPLLANIARARLRAVDHGQWQPLHAAIQPCSGSASAPACWRSAPPSWPTSLTVMASSTAPRSTA